MMTVQSTLRNGKGFTMIELVMVILVLGLLSAIAYPMYQDDLVQSSHTGVADAITSALRTARDLLYSENMLTAQTGNAYNMIDIVARMQLEGVDPAAVQPPPTAAQYNLVLGGQTYTWNLAGVDLPNDKGTITEVFP